MPLACLDGIAWQVPAMSGVLRGRAHRMRRNGGNRGSRLTPAYPHGRINVVSRIVRGRPTEGAMDDEHVGNDEADSEQQDGECSE